MIRIETLGDVGSVQPLRTALSLASLQVLLNGVDHGPLITGLPFVLPGPISAGLSTQSEVYPAARGTLRQPVSNPSHSVGVSWLPLGLENLRCEPASAADRLLPALMSNLRSRAEAIQGNGPVLNAHLMRNTRDVMYIHPHQRWLGS